MPSTTMKQYYSAQESYQEVLQHLRSSDLNFLLQESANMTIRKRFRKDGFQQNIKSEGVPLKANDVIKVSQDNLKAQNDAWTDQFEETLFECEELYKKVLEYENIMEGLHSKREKADKENKELWMLPWKHQKSPLGGLTRDLKRKR